MLLKTAFSKIVNSHWLLNELPFVSNSQLGDIGLESVNHKKRKVKICGHKKHKFLIFRRGMCATVNLLWPPLMPRTATTRCKLTNNDSITVYTLIRYDVAQKGKQNFTKYFKAIYLVQDSCYRHGLVYHSIDCSEYIKWLISCTGDFNFELIVFIFS